MLGKIKRPFWKKCSLLLLAIIIIAGVGVSCGSDSKDGISSIGDSTKKTSEEVKDTYAIGEKVKLKDTILVVNNIQKSSGSEWDKPKEGNEFIVLNVTIKNDGTSEISYNPYDFKMQNSKGQITEPEFVTLDNNTALSSGELAAGGEVSGSVVFEQPIEDKELMLKYKANMFSDKEVKIKLN